MFSLLTYWSSASQDFKPGMIEVLKGGGYVGQVAVEQLLIESIKKSKIAGDQQHKIIARYYQLNPEPTDEVIDIIIAEKKAWLAPFHLYYHDKFLDFLNACAASGHKHFTALLPYLLTKTLDHADDHEIETWINEEVDLTQWFSSGAQAIGVYQSLFYQITKKQVFSLNKWAQSLVKGREGKMSPLFVLWFQTATGKGFLLQLIEHNPGFFTQCAPEIASMLNDCLRESSAAFSQEQCELWLALVMNEPNLFIQEQMFKMLFDEHNGSNLFLKLLSHGDQAFLACALKSLTPDLFMQHTQRLDEVLEMDCFIDGVETTPVLYFMDKYEDVQISIVINRLVELSIDQAFLAPKTENRHNIWSLFALCPQMIVEQWRMRPAHQKKQVIYQFSKDGFALDLLHAMLDVVSVTDHLLDYVLATGENGVSSIQYWVKSSVGIMLISRVLKKYRTVINGSQCSKLHLQLANELGKKDKHWGESNGYRKLSLSESGCNVLSGILSKESVFLKHILSCDKTDLSSIPEKLSEAFIAADDVVLDSPLAEFWLSLESIFEVFTKKLYEHIASKRSGSVEYMINTIAILVARKKDFSIAQQLLMLKLLTYQDDCNEHISLLGVLSWFESGRRLWCQVLQGWVKILPVVSTKIYQVYKENMLNIGMPLTQIRNSESAAEINQLLLDAEQSHSVKKKDSPQVLRSLMKRLSLRDSGCSC
ncbi:hypothetical protein OAT84_01050 [Gammaproteobacteria bacterium]|nr:hypothetical protein [Gammaproteobacteria bacterium]